MARDPRIVAELGRPETADEAAARKAQSSYNYRSSKTVRNLIAALLVTVGVVAVIAFGVPRGTPPAADPIDVAGIAQRLEASESRTVIVPDVPESWLVNRAGIESDAQRSWTIVYAPGDGYLRIAQGFDADPSWPAQVLSGADSEETVTVDGIEWQRYDIGDPSAAGNIHVALSTQAGDDTILIYGKADRDTLEQAAASVADQVRELREEQE